LNCDHRTIGELGDSRGRLGFGSAIAQVAQSQVIETTLPRRGRQIQQSKGRLKMVVLHKNEGGFTNAILGLTARITHICIAGFSRDRDTKKTASNRSNAPLDSPS
jgi:hypothetical protein